MLKSIKVRLYPNNNQKNNINKLLGCYRLIYNQCLNFSIEHYKNNGKSPNIKILGNFLFQNLLKNDDFEFLKEHNTKVYQQAYINLLEAYKRFFINNAGFPRFKSRKDNKITCRFPAQAISKRNDYQSGKLSLTKQLKNMKFRCSKQYKEILNKSEIKSATLTRTKSGGYYLSILVETKPEDNKILNKPENEIIGLDLGIKDFIVTSNNDKYENLKIKRNNEKKIARLHKELSRKKKGSQNRNKSRIKLARYYEKLNNRKENYLHHLTNKLLDENQVIIIEDLNVQGMLKNHNLARSIQELSLNRFKTMLEYKSEWYGRDLVKIDRWFPSSKLCSVCNYKNNSLTLSDRVWTCPECGCEHDRDYNAALNIRNEGQRILNNKIPSSTGELTPLESSPIGSL